MTQVENNAASADISARLGKIENALVNAAAPTDEIDLKQVLAIVWRGKWFIAATTAICSIVALSVAMWLPNQYIATAIMTSASNSSSSSLSRLAGQFGGLASLAGINIGGEGERDRAIEAMELAKSWDFQEKFIRSNQIEAAVFAAVGWHRADNELVFNRKIYDPVKKLWVRTFDQEKGQTAEPSGWELYKKFSKRISITQDKKTNLVTLTVRYYSPRLAKEWADKLVLGLNQNMQNRDRVEAQRSIEYLQAKMAQTSLTEMRVAFSRLIEEQTKTLMLADVSDEYVLKKLVDVKVPEETSSPKRWVIFVLGFFGGLILSTISWLLMEFARDQRS